MVRSSGANRVEGCADGHGGWHNWCDLRGRSVQGLEQGHHRRHAFLVRGKRGQACLRLRDGAGA